MTHTESALQCHCPRVVETGVPVSWVSEHCSEFSSDLNFYSLSLWVLEPMTFPRVRKVMADCLGSIQFHSSPNPSPRMSKQAVHCHKEMDFYHLGFNPHPGVKLSLRELLNNKKLT